MSVDNTSFESGATRQVQPGDTPDLNDGLLSRPVGPSTDILRGQACFIDDATGFVEVATVALYSGAVPPTVPFVPIEDISTVAGETLPISGVGAPQRVALQISIPVGGATTFKTIFPGSYLQVSAVDGVLETWAGVTSRYARFLGIEAALLDRDAVTPFDETLTPGIVPDQSVDGELSTGSIVTFTGWVQIMENTKT